MTKDLLTTREVAEYLGVHVQAVYIAVKRGNLKQAETGTRKGYLLADVEAYKKRVEGQKEAQRVVYAMRYQVTQNGDWYPTAKRLIALSEKLGIANQWETIKGLLDVHDEIAKKVGMEDWKN